ncbi:GNAT family N-acetyltransferase [Rhizocola hellebori]|uniref:GNAT family N-acetyltransferase n=1 Tax=Rhizocola hellebori TaxID=1392758 RepID=A0A8J3Q4J4_9ACTN|nr:GNAT family protein [Rhizocola hellebori]GIH03203.1 GNAT family N-acetyltransferase [Rhizocola hellebori]
MTLLRGKAVTLRSTTAADIDTLAAIRATPEVYERWLGDDLAAEIAEDLEDPDLEMLTIEVEGHVVGMIQWSEEDEPQYRHAGMDLFLDPSAHGRGICTDAVRTLARYLIEELGHHRLVIDPAADNLAAIRCYGKAGFQAVGVMRRYERGGDGAWHDGLLMDLLAEELVTD